MSRKLRHVAASLLCTVALAWGVLAMPLRTAAAGAVWAKPTLVYESTGYTTFPLLAADSEGDVHMVFMNLNQYSRTVTTNTGGSIVYTRLHQGVWSKPIDAVVPPDGGGVNLPSMTLDQNGYIHVVFQGGALNQILYSRAHVTEAGTPRGWSRPKPLSERPGGASNISSTGNTLWFTYAADDGSVLARRSNDGGETWTNLVTVAVPAEAGGTQTHADYPRVLADERGRVHVTWNAYRLPEGWPSVGAYYAQSLDQGATWSAPQRIAPQDYGFVSMINSGANAMDRVWNSTGDIGERRHQHSSDGGQTWGPAETLIDPAKLYSGFTGFPGLAVDSAGILHVITTLGARNGESPYGIYELQWNGRSWTYPDYVSIGTGRFTRDTSIEEAQVTIGAGNHLHVAYEENFQRIWYTQRLLDTPKLPSEPVPPPTTATSIDIARPQNANKSVTNAPSTATPQVMRTPTPDAPRTAVAASAGQDADQQTSDPLRPILFAMVPSLLLVLLVVVVRRFAR